MTGQRLDVFVSETEQITRSAAQKLIDGGFVTVNGKVKPKNYRICDEDEIETDYPEPVPDTAVPENIPLDIVYEDESLLVVNKPKGMVVHPAAGNYTGTLVNALLYHCKDGLSGINGVIRPGIVHRIDKDTAGLLAVAKNDTAHISLASQIKEHKADRIYHAIVVGGLKDDEGVINKPIGRSLSDRKKMAIRQDGREAVTHYKVLARYSGFTYAEFKLETGRTHQIRVHMSSIGHPLAGDSVYGGMVTEFERRYAHLLCGQALYAKSIGFSHPETGERVFINTDIPEWFKKLLELLEKR